VRLLYITGYPLDRDDGPVSHVCGVVRGLARIGHELTLMGPAAHAVREEVGPQVRLIELPVERPPRSTLRLNLSGAWRDPRERPDAVYLRHHAGLCLPQLVRRLSRQPTVVEVNGLLHDERRAHGVSRSKIALLDVAEALALHAATHVVAVTPQLRELLIARHHLAPARVSVVLNGVDCERFAPAERQRVRARLSLPGTAPIAGFVGSLQPWRCLPELIEAWPRVLSQLPQARLVIVGDGALLPTLRARVAELRLGEHVLLTGRVPFAESIVWMQALDLGLSLYGLPVDLGAGSLKLFGYAACGVFQLGSSGTSYADVLGRHGFGDVVDATDSAALARALVRCLADREQLAARGAAARAVVERQFSWQRAAYDIEGLIARLTA
jgi:glycosyltransferase involved in cell wall biosynthesis